MSPHGELGMIKVDAFEFFSYTIFLFVDIDECQTSNPCNDSTICENILGNFNCICPSGFENKTGVCKGEKSI